MEIVALFAIWGVWLNTKKSSRCRIPWPILRYLPIRSMLSDAMVACENSLLTSLLAAGDRFATRLTDLQIYKVLLGALSWVVYVPISNSDLKKAKVKGLLYSGWAILLALARSFSQYKAKCFWVVQLTDIVVIIWHLSFTVCLPFSSGSILNALFLWAFLVCKPSLFPLLFGPCIGSIW